MSQAILPVGASRLLGQAGLLKRWSMDVWNNGEASYGCLDSLDVRILLQQQQQSVTVLTVCTTMRALLDRNARHDHSRAGRCYSTVRDASLLAILLVMMACCPIGRVCCLCCWFMLSQNYSGIFPDSYYYFLVGGSQF